MLRPGTIRHVVLAMTLLLVFFWVFASASPVKEPAYPNAQFLISATDLQKRLKNEPFVIIDVRNDDYFDGKMIHGAIRLPWSRFRSEDSARNMGGLFVGIDKAQQILGQHGIFPNDKVVLYDSIARDGGATASYLFWILDMLGHEKKMILDRGIDGWIDSGGPVANEPAKREPLLYQAAPEKVELRRWVDEDFIYPRLGDPYYQIIDVRSAAEYQGKKLNTTLDKAPLKAGHIPGAYNINYENNWADTKTKAMKSYRQLIELYRGIDPERAVIVYCHSARRSSFSYFALRLIGFDDVMVYDNSWYGWGQPDKFYPVETTENVPPGARLPEVSQQTSRSKSRDDQGAASSTNRQKDADTGNTKSKYISCGG